MRSSAIDNSFQKLSSGVRINSAADDAAGLAISQKILTQTNGYDIGTRNAEDGQNMANVAEGGLSGISDSLSRMRELAVQASNGTYGKDDKTMIQEEINQLKGSIVDQARGTQFNKMKLLDNSMADVKLATDPQGNGMTMQMANATLENLGIADFDVTGDFDISTLDDAIDKVSSARSSLGATSNRLDYTINSNTNASMNLTAANSRIEDTDYAKETSKLKTQQVLEQYKIFMQNAKIKQQSGFLALFQM
jgi:flagellin